MKKILLAVIVVISGSVSDVNADIYEQAVELIENNNLTLKQLRETQLSEIAVSRVENNLSDPEIEFERLWGHGAEPRWGLSISETFDFPGTYHARRKAIDAMKEANELRYKVELVAKLIEARELLVEIAYCNKAMNLERKVVEDMRLIVEMSGKSFENGESTILELNRAKIELANNIVKLNELESRYKECREQLSFLGIALDDQDAISITYPIDRLLTIEEYHDGIENDIVSYYYNKLRIAEVNNGKARAMEQLPELTVGYVHEREEGINFNGFSVGITLPFSLIEERKKSPAILYRQLSLKRGWHRPNCAQRLMSNIIRR